MHLRGFGAIAVGVLLAGALPACKWVFPPTYPSAKIGEGLKHICATEYRLSVETRHIGKSLQTFLWRISVLGDGPLELRPETAESLEHLLLCATRVALSTDARLEFIEIKVADVLTGASVTLWRYVPDIIDSMYTRIGDEEYINRLVIEVDTESKPSLGRQGVVWSPPITMREFLAKQVILRTKRLSPVGLQARADLSQPATLGIVIDNWSTIEKQLPGEKDRITALVEEIARTVVRGYRFKGFQGIVLRDGRGAALRRWTI